MVIIRKTSLMFKKRQEEQGYSQSAVGTPSALDVISKYVAALSSGDSNGMNSFRSPDFVLDFVHGDAFEDGPLSVEETKKFWPAWFAGFPEMDYEVTRTVAAQEVVVTQWTFTGTQSGPLGPPIFENRRKPTDRTIRFRGVSIYDVRDGLIQRETMYMDLATLMVELGVEP
jgi:steroid delta-isomerase-like uncharacterized protein